MSKRTDGLEQRLREAEIKLAKAEREVAEVSGANGRLAAKLAKSELTLIRTHNARDEAFKQVTALQEQVRDKERIIAELSTQLDDARRAVSP